MKNFFFCANFFLLYRQTKTAMFNHTIFFKPTTKAYEFFYQSC